MNQGESLANRLNEVILNGTSIANTNFKKELESIDWEFANQKFGSFHSIAEIARHTHYYIAGIKNVFASGELKIRDKYSFDFLPVKSAREWSNLQRMFWNDTRQLASYIQELPEAQLQEDFVNKKYGTYLRNLDGLIEHSYYHLGQIVLIKKMLLQKI